MTLLPVEHDLALLLVRLHEHARGADEVRVAHGQDGLRVHEGDEAEHAPLLVRDAHVLHRAVLAACMRQPTTQSKSRFLHLHLVARSCSWLASPTKRTRMIKSN
jgi:hypothetical protein